MRITFVLPGINLGGGSRVIGIFARALVRRGHEVLILASPASYGSIRTRIRRFLRGETNQAVEQQEIGFRTYFGDGKVPVRFLDANRAVTDADVPDADVVIATFWTTAMQVMDLSSSKGAKAFFLQGYEVVPGQTIQGMDDAWRLPLHKITSSRWLTELARTRFDDAEATEVPDSVDTELFKAPPRSRQKKPTLGFLYATHAVKGVDITLKAIELIRERYPDLHVQSFGAVQPIAELPLGNASFQYRPAQDDIRGIYSSCDVWVCGSRSEGFHLPPLEAMACCIDARWRLC
jgi:glycosyltransferase involved in cell wall biosynthesis